MFPSDKQNTIPPSNSHSHSARSDENNFSKKSSATSGIELQDFDLDYQDNQNNPNPLLDQSNRSDADCAKKKSKWITLPQIICLGLGIVILLGILLSRSRSTGPNSQMVGYRVSNSYVSADRSLYSVALKPINQLISVELHGTMKNLALLPNLNMSIQC